MHLMTILIPRILDLIDSNLKKLRVVKPPKMEKQIKSNTKSFIAKQASFSTFKGMLFSSTKGKKSGLHFASDENDNNTQESSDLIQDLNDASQDPKIAAKIINSMKKVLEKVGENSDDALQLLNYVVLTDLATESLYLMKHGTKTYLLSELLVRILNRVSENRCLVLLLDDIQW